MTRAHFVDNFARRGWTLSGTRGSAARAYWRPLGVLTHTRHWMTYTKLETYDARDEEVPGARVFVWTRREWVQ